MKLWPEEEEASALMFNIGDKTHDAKLERDEIRAQIAEINEKLEALRMAVDEIRRGGNER